MKMAKTKQRTESMWSKSFLKKGVGRKPTHGFEVVQNTVALVPTVHVSAAAIFNLQDEVLLARRPEGKSLSGLWEFPGGKLALMRELNEELGIKVMSEHIQPLTFVSCDTSIEGKNLLMYLFKVSKWKGVMEPLENQSFAWVKIEQLGDYFELMPKADVPLAKFLIQNYT
jgi:8-oxo-dGTP diphosphatase